LLLIVSKLPAYRRGVLLSFGYGGMDTKTKRVYLAGYFFMVLGACGLLGALVLKSG
jgi:hypothetical protein